MREAKPIALLVAAMLVFAAMSVSAPSVADARPRPAGKHKSNFEANKTFGLGIMLGYPSGLSGKYFLGPDTALDFGVGFGWGYRGGRGIHVHGDFLWHPLSLVSADAFELPLYFGVGFRFWDFDDDRYYDNGASALGLRVPLGVAFDFNEVPIDIFVEVALVVDFLFGYTCNDCAGIRGDLHSAIGFRYYFN